MTIFLSEIIQFVDFKSSIWYNIVISYISRDKNDKNNKTKY